MASPTFECDGCHVHVEVKTNADIQYLQNNVFNVQGYSKSQDQNVYFVHDEVKESFEEIYENLPQVINDERNNQR